MVGTLGGGRGRLPIGAVDVRRLPAIAEATACIRIVSWLNKIPIHSYLFARILPPTSIEVDVVIVKHDKERLIVKLPELSTVAVFVAPV